MASTPPTYREAYPRLDVREVQRAVLGDSLVCRYESETGASCGEAFVLDVSETALLLGFALQRVQYFAFRKGEVSLALEHAPDPVNRERYFFLCPECGQCRKILFFKWVWRCATCHKLGYRSQLARYDVRYDEWAVARREELHALLAKGRPHRMRHATFEALQSELEELDEWLEDSPRKVASAEHRYLVTATWMEPKDLPNGLAHDGFYVLGNAIEKYDWYRPRPWPSGE
jgi:hypothetical protein